MRIGLLLDPGSVERAVSDAGRAESTGLDFCWIPRSFTGARSGAVVAAAIAQATASIRLLLECSADQHPVEVAEELIVIDLLSNGRVAAVIQGSDPEEHLEVLQAALAGRPLDHSGPRWQLPRQGTQSKSRQVTPMSPQLELPVWLEGRELAQLAFEHGITFVGGLGDSSQAMAQQWATLREVNSRQARRLPHVALRRTDVSEGSFLDVDRVVAQLRDERKSWDLDTCVIDLAGPSAARSAAIAALGRRVRPRLQAEELVPQLVASWDLDEPIIADRAAT